MAPIHDAAPPYRPGPARIVVDLDAISENTAVLDNRARAAGASAGVMAVVKADGYGHGLVPSAHAARRGGASWLGVALLAEALELRTQGVPGPVLSWLHTPGADFEAAMSAGIDLGVSGRWALEEIAEAARRTGRIARIHLKVDTGLGRHGVTMDDLPALIEAAAALQAQRRVEVVGVFSHFAYADAPDHPTVRRQQDEFAVAVAECERAGFPLEVRHLANSAATLTNPSAAFDLVRPGLAVYGLSPVPDLGGPADFGLRPAMSVTVDVALVKKLNAGQGISYGHQYRTTSATRVAVLPIGYADGLPRAATNVGPVALGAHRYTIAGRVCMDQVVVDLGPESDVRAGQIATLIGPSGPTAQDWAEVTGTICYEIVTRMSTRLPRVYRGGRS